MGDEVSRERYLHYDNAGETFLPQVVYPVYKKGYQKK